MATRGIYIGEVIKFGWNVMRDNLGFWIGILLVTNLAPALLQAIGSIVFKDFTALQVVFWLASLVLSLEFTLAVYGICLKFCDNQKGTFSELFAYFHLVPRFLIASILYGLIVVGGTILLVVPGVIWALKNSLYAYFILEKDAGVVDSLRASARATDGARWDLLGFWCVATLIALLGLLALVVGLFAAIPTLAVATALVYRKLLAQAEAVEQPS